MNQERRQAWPRRVGKAEGARVYREGIRQPAAVEHRHGRGFETGRVSRGAVANGAVAAPSEDLQRGAPHLHADRAELAVEGRIARRVGEQVVELVVFVDPLEGRREIVATAPPGTRQCPPRAAPGPFDYRAAACPRPARTPSSAAAASGPSRWRAGGKRSSTKPSISLLSAVVAALVRRPFASIA